MKTARRRGFSLLELMIVIGIGALLSAMSFGVINNTKNGNRRAQCASNLAQIHNALRLYAQDYDGLYPYANPAGLTSEATSERGLWLLLKYPGGNNAGYLKSQSAFSCPNDQVSTKALFTNSMSYQWVDDRSPAPNATFSVFRESENPRQLRYFKDATPQTEFPQRRPAETTVVTWCRWHRAHDGVSGATKSDEGKDNVLFLDGRVQSLPVLQAIPGATFPCAGWERLPLENANATQAAGFCSPIS